MAYLLRYRESFQLVHSHNTRAEKNIGRLQRGGTATVLNERLAPFVNDSGVDRTGLGRWSWYLSRHKTRVITVYAPCGDANSGESTVYSQHMNYIWQKGLRTNPKAMFRDDILGALRIWRNNGKRVILMMDVNEHVSDVKICSQLQQSDIDTHPSVDSMTPDTSSKTWFRGKEAIDDIWFSSDL